MQTNRITKIALFLAALLVCTTFVGGAFAAYSVRPSEKVVAISASSAAWDGVLSVNTAGVSWFESDDCRANIFITYSDSSTNAPYPGAAMTRTAANSYTVQTNAAKTISKVVVIRMNAAGTYMYNKTGDITSIPSNHSIALSSGDLTEIPADERTPYYALTVRINVGWFDSSVADACVYVWYEGGAPAATYDMVKTEAGSDTYTVNWSAVNSGKTVAGFMFLRVQKSNHATIWNKSQDYAPSDIPSSRAISVYDLYNW